MDSVHMYFIAIKTYALLHKKLVFTQTCAYINDVFDWSLSEYTVKFNLQTLYTFTCHPAMEPVEQCMEWHVTDRLTPQ